MPYEMKKSSDVSLSVRTGIYKAAYTCIKELGGKVLKHDPEKKLTSCSNG